MGAAARGGRPRHRARRQRRPARRRARRRRGAPRGGAGRRRPSPCARLGARRCAVGGDRRVLRVRAARPARQRRHHRRHARARCGGAPRVRAVAGDPGRAAAVRRAAGGAPAVVAAPGLGRRPEPPSVQRDAPVRCGRSSSTGCPGSAASARRSGVDDVLLELLQRTPVPWELRWREMVPPPQWTASDWLATFRARQAPWLYDVTDRLDIPPDRPARIQYLTATADSHPLGVPLVAKGDAGTSYVAEIAALARQGDEGRRELNLRQNSIALLEALLAFAAVQELDKAASAELVDGLTVEDRAAAGFVRRGVRTPDLVRVEEPDPQRLPMQFASARALAAQTAPGSQRRGARPGGDAPAQRRAARSHRPAGEPGQRARPVPRRARRARGGTGRRAGVGVPGRARPVQLAHRRLVHVVRHRPPRRAARGSAAGRPRRMLRLGRGPPARPRSGRRQPGLHRRAVAGARRDARRCCAAAGSPTAPRMRSTSTCRRRVCAKR